MSEATVLIKPIDTAIDSDPILLEGLQVVDQSGKGIEAVYFWIDANSNPISYQISTDVDGSFNIYVPDLGNDTFINFWQEGYDPVVKTPGDLSKNRKIVLKKKGSGSQMEQIVFTTIFGLIVAGVVHQAGKKNAVGGIATDLKAKFNRASTGQKVLVIGAAGLGAYLILNHFFGHSPTKQQATEIQGAKDKLKELAYDGIFPTKGLDFAAMASIIVDAVDDCGTDEDSVYRQFEKMQNDADIYSLIVAYGVAAYKGCFSEGSWFGDVHHTLSQTIVGDFSSSQVSHINGILSDRNILYSF